MKIVIAAALAALTLAACGGGEDDTPTVARDETPATSAAAPTPPSPSASSSPAVMSLAEAAQRYPEIIGPFNAALKAVSTAEAAYDAGRTRTRFQTLVRAADNLARVNSQTCRALSAEAWPPEVADPMAALVRLCASQQTPYTLMARATNATEYQDAVERVPPGNGESNVVRITLGLPDAPILD